MRSRLIIFCLCLATFAGAQDNHDLIWPIAAPEDVGLSSAALNKLFDYARSHKTKVHSVQILRHGKLVLDAYFFPFNSNSRHDVASVTKSVTSTLLGIAIDGKYIPDVNAKALKFFPELTDKDARKQKITLEDLITMRSGFDCGTNLSDPKINVDQRLIEIRRCQDWIKCILDLPMAADPGSTFAYCNGNCHLISEIISATTKKSLSQFANEHLFLPLGIKDYYWPTDPKGINYGWSDLQLHPYDMLKFGQLMLSHGTSHGKQIISETWLKSATKEHVINTGGKDHYGYFWWVPGGDHPDVFEAVGRGGQRITVWPSQDMIIVFTGGGFETSELVPFIVNSIKSDGPIASNPTDLKRLKENVDEVARTSKRAASRTLPALASVISGKTFQLSPNGLNLETLQMTFDKPDEAMLNLRWAGEVVACVVGLDGVERFSNNPIIRLPQACLGDWLDRKTFVISLNLVGGINVYHLILGFSDDGQNVIATLSEGTGLNNETFSGKLGR